MTLQSWVAGAGCILLTAFFGFVAVVSGIFAFVHDSGAFQGFSLMAAVIAFLLAIGFGMLSRECLRTNPDEDDD